METVLRGVVLLLWNLAHCFLTTRGLCLVTLIPWKSPNSSLDFSTEVIVNTRPDLFKLSQL